MGDVKDSCEVDVIGLTGIQITTNPTKLTYFTGDTFDKTGMVVKAKYSDDSLEVIEDYSVDKTVLGKDDNIVTITYKTFSKPINITVKEVSLTGITIETNPTKLEYIVGDVFDPRGMVIKANYSNGNSLEIGNYTYSEVPLEITDNIITITYGDFSLDVDITVDYPEVVEGYTMIYTPEKLLELSSEDSLDGKYRLGKDLDCTGITWVDPKATLTGTFDGDNYTIKNVSFSVGTSKRGALFSKINGGTVVNIKFDNINVSSGSESPAIISGLANGEVTFENIEFTNCHVETSNNYVGLLFARNDSGGANISINRITVKNNCSVKSAKYGGGLIGDLGSGSTLIAKNIDLDISADIAGGQCGLISGRDRGTTQIFENIRVKGNITGGNKLGFFNDGTSAASNVTIKNVLITAANIDSTATSQVDVWKGGGSATPTLINCYFIEDAIQIDLGGNLYDTIASEGCVAVSEDLVNIEWYQNSLLLDFNNAWEEDGEGIKLIGSSSNQIGEDSEIISILLITIQAKTYYMNGEDFTSEGLIVKAVYDNGAEKNLDAIKYSVDSSNFDKDVAGEYTITVSIGSLSETYEVEVVEVIGFNVYDEFTVKTYILNEEISYLNLVIKAVLSDNSEKILTEEEYSIITDYSSTTAGVYNVIINYRTYKSFAYQVTVIENKPDPVDNVVELLVDKDFADVDGTLIENKPAFKTMSALLDYLNACNYPDMVEKIVYINNGVYEEKITIKSSLKNLTFIGESKAGTILTYHAAAGHKQPNEAIWGTQGSASVSIKGEGFKAKNLTFENSFDYANSNISDKQGVAAYIEADKVVFYNCAFLGNQDTLYAKWGRQYYKDCYIEGNVDFIFGNNAPALFEDCEIHTISRNSNNNGYLTAHKGTHTGNDKGDYGYVFLRCKLTADEGVGLGTVALGRPWNPDATVAYLYCEMGEHISKLPYSNEEGMHRYEIMSGNSPVNADFKEYGNNGPGAITESIAGVSLMTEAEAATYSIEKIFAAINGEIIWPDLWDANASLLALQN